MVASVRTPLFVPANRPDQFAKAAASGADVILQANYFVYRRFAIIASRRKCVEMPYEPPKRVVIADDDRVGSQS